jgi:hypothetical protein
MQQAKAEESHELEFSLCCTTDKSKEASEGDGVRRAAAKRITLNKKTKQMNE